MSYTFPLGTPFAPTGAVTQAALDLKYTAAINDLYALLSTVSAGMDSGQVSITPSAANTPTSLAVTFSKTFTSAPKVMVTANSTAPGTAVTGVAATSITTTGCLLWLTRTSTTATQVMWLAVLTQ